MHFSSFSGRLCGLVVRVPGYISGFDSRPYQIFWEVVGLERGPLSLVSTIEELLERKIRGCRLESREYGHKDPSRWPRGTFYPQKLALTSPTSGYCSVGIVHSRTQATDFLFFSSLSLLSQAFCSPQGGPLWTRLRTFGFYATTRSPFISFGQCDPRFQFVKCTKVSAGIYRASAQVVERPPIQTFRQTDPRVKELLYGV
jgi:hypothetical protein